MSRKRFSLAFFCPFQLFQNPAKNYNRHGENHCTSSPVARIRPTRRRRHGLEKSACAPRPFIRKWSEKKNVASIRLEKVAKIFPNGTEAVHNLDLEIGDGEYVALVGPSGCGKTTILRIIAGLEQPTRGRVYLDDQDVMDQSPQNRDVAMVFQSHALYPHRTVRDNLGFGLRLRRAARKLVVERVEQVANSLKLSPLLNRKPGQLSGGERQRVALGRAMTRRPRAFLLDEPLSNLDAQLRIQMRGELTRIHQEMATTTVYVTHDQEEAMVLGDRVAVLRSGKLQQFDRPSEIYRRPANLFVAGFIVTPAMNFFRARCHTDDG